MVPDTLLHAIKVLESTDSMYNVSIFISDLLISIR